MSVGFGFIRRLLQHDEPLSLVEASGISGDFFVGEELDALNYIREFYISHDSLPTIGTIERETGIAIPAMPDEPPSYWADKIKKRYIFNELTKAIKETTRKLSNQDVTGALDTFQNASTSLMDFGAIQSTAYAEQLLPVVTSLHHLARDKSGLTGIDLGFPYINEVTGGAQPGDLILIAGMSGVGKTYVLLKMALAAYLAGERVLFDTNEMSKEPCARRLFALASEISATDLRLGRLGDFGIAAFEKRINDLFGGTKRFKFIEGLMSGKVRDLALQVREFKPTALFIDGIYLKLPTQRYKSNWETVFASVVECKKIGIGSKIPVIATTQHNRDAERKASQNTLGYSKELTNTASLIFDLSADADTIDDFSHITYRILRFLKGREGEAGAIKIAFNTKRSQIYQSEVILNSSFASVE